MNIMACETMNRLWLLVLVLVCFFFNSNICMLLIQIQMTFTLLFQPSSFLTEQQNTQDREES